MRAIASAAMIAGSLTLLPVSASAQNAQSATESAKTLEWQNPERIADIQANC